MDGKAFFEWYLTGVLHKRAAAWGLLQVPQKVSHFAPVELAVTFPQQSNSSSLWGII